jgi:transcriptional regulator with XRE-family HTH domain
MTRPCDIEVTASLGRRIGELRRGRGWSAAELARRAGIGKATLSEIEAGRRNTTLETLDALTRALGVPLSAPLPQPLPVTMPAGETVSAELAARFDDGGVTTELYRMRVAAGAVDHPAAHAPGLRKVVMVFAGGVTVSLPDHAFYIATGDSAEWAGDRPHTYAADGTRDVEATVLLRYGAQAQEP